MGGKNFFGQREDLLIENPIDRTLTFILLLLASLIGFIEIVSPSFLESYLHFDFRLFSIFIFVLVIINSLMEINKKLNRLKKKK